MIHQERIDRLLPYLRGFAFDPNTMYKRFTLLFPAHWDVTHLKTKSIMLGVVNSNGVANTFLVGVFVPDEFNPDVPQAEDMSMDWFYDEIEYIINYNNEKEAKEALLEKKKKELEDLFNRASLEEMENYEIGLKDWSGRIVKPSATGMTFIMPFTPEIEVPEQDPTFGTDDEAVAIAFAGGDPFEEADFDPFAREEDDTNDSTIPFEPDEDVDINLPGIVKDMVKHNNGGSELPIN